MNFFSNMVNSIKTLFGGKVTKKTSHKKSLRELKSEKYSNKKAADEPKEDLDKPAEKEEDPVEYWWDYSCEKPFDIPLIEAIDEQLIYKEITTLIENDQCPVIDIPQNAVKAMELMGKRDFNFTEVAAMINKSPSMAGEFLKISNSSAFCRGQKILDLNHALPWLGPKNVKAMLYLYSSKLTVAKNLQLNDLATRIIHHSSTTGVIAHYLSGHYFPDADTAFLAGLLHDIGKLAIVKIISDKVKLPHDLEALYEENFGPAFTDFHEQAGMVLAKDWHVDPMVMHVIEHHHNIGTPEYHAEDPLAQTLCGIVNVADTMAKILGSGNQIDSVNIFDTAGAKELGMIKDPQTIAFLEKIPELVKNRKM